MSRRRGEREAPDMAAMVERVARAMVRRATEGDLEVMTALSRMHAAVSAARTDAARALNEFEGGPYSWAEIGAELGVSRQAAQQAYGRQRPVDAPEDLHTVPLFEVAG